MENVDFEKIKADIENKTREVVGVVEEKVSKAVRWGIENPEKVVAIIGVTATLLKSSQSLVVNHRMKVERARIDHTYYDPSTGFHWELCRKATNNDRMAISQRKANGEDIYHILRDLKLIK